MNQVVFNFHDVILLMTAMLCVLFSILLIATNPPKNISNYFLAAFLLTHALIPLHELMLWGAEFKHTVRNNFPQIYFVGGFAYYIDTALLYFYVKSLIFRDFHLRRKDAYHLIPIMLFAIFMVLTFFRYSLVQRLEWINHEVFVYSAHYLTVDLMCKIIRVIYCIACLRLILKYKDLLKATHSNIEKIDVLWLRLLVVGFLVVAIMELFLSAAKFLGIIVRYDFQYFNVNFFEFIGLSGYYVSFVLICTLVFTSMRYFTSFEAVRQKKALELVKKPVQEKLLNPEYAEKIDNVMREEKPYLRTDITLDILAEILVLPVRDLSMIINRHFGSNFYEFINGYRIEEAKKILCEPQHKTKTITDIYLEIGFNSKSVFNTFFKKIVGQTPSEYRQTHQTPEMVP